MSSRKFQMGMHCFEARTIRLVFYITIGIGITILAFICHAPVFFISTQSTQSIIHLQDKLYIFPVDHKIPSQTNLPSELAYIGTKSQHSIETTKKENFKNYPSSLIAPARREQMQTNKTQTNTLELEEDTGEDFSLTPTVYSLDLIKQGIEQMHNSVLEYLKTNSLSTEEPTLRRNITKEILKQIKLNEEIKFNKNNIKNLAVNIIMKNNRKDEVTTNATKQLINTNQGQTLPNVSNENLSEKEKSCNVSIELEPCNCTRILHPKLAPCPNKDITQEEIIKNINTTFGESTCNNWATMRGNNQKVVSFSLFGTFPNTYYKSATKVIQQISTMYPGWLIRFYHNMNLNQHTQMVWMCSLVCTYPHVDFCHASTLSSGIGDLRWTIETVWRLSTMGDPLIKRYMIRDLDSPVLQREVNAVTEWIKSEKCFHIIRDNPQHKLPMMAGMWGGCNSFHPEAMPGLREKVFRWSRKSVSHISRDQVNFGMLLWPTIRKNHIAHDAFSCLQYPESQPFPSQRENFTFIGMRVFRENYADERIYQPCPIQCRPAKHKDWKYC